MIKFVRSSWTSTEGISIQKYYGELHFYDIDFHFLLIDYFIGNNGSNWDDDHEDDGYG